MFRLVDVFATQQATEDLSMPRMIAGTMTLEDIENEILFTVASLDADPDAKVMLPHTDGWLPRLDGLRIESRAIRLGVNKTSAAKIVANARLDLVCGRLGDQLLLAVHKDREAPRWKKFFPSTMSAFQRQPLVSQVAGVFGWLSAIDDPLLEQYRPELTQWADAAKTALDTEAKHDALRAQFKQTRDTHAQQLTADRDKLHDLLSDIARDQGLGRTWPDTFFRSGKDE